MLCMPGEEKCRPLGPKNPRRRRVCFKYGLVKKSSAIGNGKINDTDKVIAVVEATGNSLQLLVGKLHALLLGKRLKLFGRLRGL